MEEVWYLLLYWKKFLCEFKLLPEYLFFIVAKFYCFNLQLLARYCLNLDSM